MSTPFHESTNQWLNFGAFLWLKILKKWLTSSVFRHARQIEEQDHMAQERLCITWSNNQLVFIPTTTTKLRFDHSELGYHRQTVSNSLV
jgi:hypothetical protein